MYHNVLSRFVIFLLTEDVVSYFLNFFLWKLFLSDQPLQLFKPLLEMEAAKRQDLNKAILHMCNYPKDIDTFLVLVCV